MRLIKQEEIQNLGITPSQCVEWVREAFCFKYDSQLPPKISLHPQGADFFNTMPCLLPSKYDRFGVKIVSRIAGNKPSLHSDLLLYQASTGTLLSFMEADWITQMRTGAVAALAIQTLQSSNATVYAFVGLGSTAIATMHCLLDILPKEKHIICKLLKYKNQAEQFISYFAQYKNVQFQVVESNDELILELRLANLKLSVAITVKSLSLIVKLILVKIILSSEVEQAKAVCFTICFNSLPFNTIGCVFKSKFVVGKLFFSKALNVKSEFFE